MRAYVHVDQTSREAREARRTALRIVAAQVGGEATYVAELETALRSLAVREGDEVRGLDVQRLALLLDALSTVAWAAVGVIAVTLEQDLAEVLARVEEATERSVRGSA